jgi:hypothetical protein
MKYSVPSTKAFLVRLCVAFVFTWSTGYSQIDTTRLVPPSSLVPASYFGIHIHRAGAATPWPKVSVAEWRLWDAHVAWPDIEPHEGRWNFANLDAYLALAKEHHVEVLLPLGLSPSWESARPHEPSAYQPGFAAEPRQLTDWDNYVRTVVQHCKGQVHAYEVWNEPNYKQFWTGNVDQLLAMTRNAYNIVKATDPSALLVSPSATGGMGGVEWLDAFLAKGGGHYVNAIGFHFYADTPEKMVPLIQKAREVMTRHGVGGLPLWTTEAGWAKPKPFPSQELAAAYVARAYILDWAAGVQRFYWYAWDNHGFVSIETTKADNATLTPAGEAYATIQDWLVGAQLRSCDMNAEQTWICNLDRARSNGRIIWNASHPVNLSIPASWHAASATPLLSKPFRLSASTVEVTQIPVLITSSAQ